MRLDEAALDEYTDRFSSVAWRQETRDSYDVATDDDGFRRYRAGLPPEPEFGAGWHRWLSERRAENRQVYRVRVLYARPSLYQMFEIEWPYRMNARYGETTRILDLTERRRPPELLDDEFWMLDHDRVAVMSYDAGGVFKHADTYEGERSEPWIASVTSAWQAAEPLGEWWEGHPQYHRASWPTDGA